MANTSAPVERNNPDDWTGPLSHYLDQAPLDAAYSLSLLARLEQELPATRTVRSASRQKRPRRTRTLIASVGAAAVLLASMLLYHFRVGEKQVNEAGRKEQSPRVATNDFSQGMLAARTGGFGFPSTAITVGQSTLIVRGRVKSFNGALVTYAVDHTIYGDREQDEVVVDMSNLVDLHRGHIQNVYAQNGVEVGKEVILYVSELGKAADGKPTYLRVGAAYDVPPTHSLDNVEKDILKVVRDGSFSEPDASSGSFLRNQLEKAPLVVIATLQRVDDRSAIWQIESRLRGKIEQQAIVVDHDLFHRRALAIAASELRLKKGAKPDLEERNERAASIMQQLIQSELSLAKRGILFITPLKENPDGYGGRVVYRLYDDAAREKHFQSVLKAIQSPTSVPERF